MDRIILSLLAFIAGIFLAIQGGYNSQLSVLLKSPILASLCAFIASALYALLLVSFSIKEWPSTIQLAAVPRHLWFVGGLFSVMGISLYYFTIPRLGVSTMISLGLCGQLVFAVIAGHYGWFNLPVEPISVKRIIGILALLTGILCINIKS